MRELLLVFYICTTAIIFLVAELYGIFWMIMWLYPYDAWWEWPLLAFLVLSSMVVMVFLLWMLSILFWEVTGLKSDK